MIYDFFFHCICSKTCSTKIVVICELSKCIRQNRPFCHRSWTIHKTLGMRIFRMLIFQINKSYFKAGLIFPVCTLNVQVTLQEPMCWGFFSPYFMKKASLNYVLFIWLFAELFSDNNKSNQQSEFPSWWEQFPLGKEWLASVCVLCFPWGEWHMTDVLLVYLRTLVKNKC